MHSLIWIGNTLYPRGVVILFAGIAVVVIIGTFTFLTRE